LDEAICRRRVESRRIHGDHHVEQQRRRIDRARLRRTRAGGIGFVVFTWSRRKRVPSQCGEQREALELAERAVLYWEAARAHLEAVDRERRLVDNVASDNSTHASLVAKAVEGLHTAMKQRDDRQMELIHCMAGGIPEC